MDAFGLSEHWIDLLVATLIATLGFLGRDRLRSMDARHQRAEDKFEEHEKQIADHETRITVVEKGERAQRHEWSE